MLVLFVCLECVTVRIYIHMCVCVGVMRALGYPGRASLVASLRMWG